MRRYQITISGKTFEVEIISVRGEQARVAVNGHTYEVTCRSGPTERETAAPRVPIPVQAPPPPSPLPVEVKKPTVSGEVGTVTAPMPGAILEVLVQVGDRVQAAQVVVKLEAMKMENDLKSPIAGVVRHVRVAKGVNVAVGEVLLTVSPD